MSRSILALRNLFLSGLLLIGAAANVGASEAVYDPKLAAELGADEYGMRGYVFCVLKTGPTDAEIVDPDQRIEIFNGHFANMSRLAEEGLLVLAGPFIDGKPNRGLYIFNVTTIAAATVLVESDPAVQAGIFEYELTQLYCSAALMKVSELHEKIQKTKID